MMANSQCSRCDEWDHWYDDPECRLNKDKKKNSHSTPVRPMPRKQPQPSGYFTFTNTKEQPNALVADGLGPKKGKQMMQVACDHCLERSRVVTRGANPSSRYITCTACDEHVAFMHKTGSATDCWRYLFCTLWWTKLGNILRRQESARRLTNDCSPKARPKTLPKTKPKASTSASSNTTPQRTRAAAPNNEPNDETPCGYSSSSVPPLPEEKEFIQCPGAPEEKRSSKWRPQAGIDFPFFDIDPPEDIKPFLIHPVNAHEVIDFGKHSGQKVGEMCADWKNVRYCVWLIKAVKYPNTHPPMMWRIARFLYEEHHGGRWPPVPPTAPKDDDWIIFEVDPDVECLMVNGNPDVENSSDPNFEAYIGSESNPPGICVLGTACNSTMEGRLWRESYERALVENGQTATVEKVPYVIQIGGVGGFATSTYKVTFPVGICGNNGQFESFEIDQDILMLISRRYQANLDMHHHIRAQTIDIDIFGLEGIKVLEVVPGRHPGLSLLDFNGTHPGIESKASAFSL